MPKRKNTNRHKFQFQKANTNLTDGGRRSRWSDHLHRIDAHNRDTGRSQGHLCWHPKTGELCDIFVEIRMRRKGIATTMWEAANKIAKKDGIVAPKHSSARTENGDVWAKSIGGNLPARAR